MGLLTDDPEVVSYRRATLTHETRSQPAAVIQPYQHVCSIGEEKCKEWI